MGGRFDQTVGEGLDFDWESAFQWGTFADRSIRAYTIQTETGYTFVNSPGHIRPFLRFDVSSGTHGQDLGTFNSLFPRGAYITPKAVPPFALDNVINIQPMVWFQPAPHFETSVGWHWFWRYRAADGLYTLGGVPVIQANLTNARYIMQMPDLEVRWAPVRHVLVAVNLMGTINGPYVNSTFKSNDTVYTNLGFIFRF